MADPRFDAFLEAAEALLRDDDGERHPEGEFMYLIAEAVANFGRETDDPEFDSWEVILERQARWEEEDRRLQTRARAKALGKLLFGDYLDNLSDEEAAQLKRDIDQQLESSDRQGSTGRRFSKVVTVE